MSSPGECHQTSMTHQLTRAMRLQVQSLTTLVLLVHARGIWLCGIAARNPRQNLCTKRRFLENLIRVRVAKRILPMSPNSRRGRVLEKSAKWKGPGQINQFHPNPWGKLHWNSCEVYEDFRIFTSRKQQSLSRHDGKGGACKTHPIWLRCRRPPLDGDLRIKTQVLAQHIFLATKESHRR
jgi:hypothetical protein